MLDTSSIELSIVMPCLNEAETLAVCIDKAMGYLKRSGVVGEVVIADNGSTDGSQLIAEERGARVVAVEAKGYGSALMGGITAAYGTYVIMGDADDSYDFDNLEPFVERLRAGDELVMGNRFRGGIEPGAMPPLHKYLGNPVLSTIGRMLFRSEIRDFHCGLRGFNRESILSLGLVTTGMEFASEVVVKSTLGALRVSEVPTTLKKDGRSRPPHLRSWHDGWRHLRFLLIFSPRWLFLIPGTAAFVLGFVGVMLLGFGPVVVGRVGFTYSSQLYLAALTVVGYQSVLFAILTKIYAQREGFRIPRSRNFDRLQKRISLESGAIVGLLLFVVGLGVAVAQLVGWASNDFGPLEAGATLRAAIPAALLMMLGAQTIMAGMFLGVLSVGVKRS
ncbi:glycosyltransferase family 2 protein [Cryobacterium levicorallinum]|uniref:Glycosyltransferase family 2 protein n=1 Tax=Cryobacterium levicorallinum TaxID=995038 RepID=A0A1I3E1A1_9MICO|nr:glycosyltransferase family 2 protein [Cryobacterium levicorallinum]TFB81505.1 glycosyltransferase family 2 protein [Cryobacterium levicorallinum]GEP28546.1 dolichol-P-glucose synthetase [Cryobacterium levicorallinum]SFH92757.1 Glycosyltransferase involved in cell wall bisynthesis [Cryobacterium levicorallinum]